MYRFIENVNAERHDAFVQSHPLCNLLQSSSWAKVKDNWGHAFIGVEDEDVLVASSLVLIKQLPFGLTMLYLPRGPVLDFNNKELVGFFMKNLKQFAKKRHAIYVTMDPAVHCNDYLLSEVNENRYEQSAAIVSLLESQGALFKGYTKDIDATVQPRYHANVYAQEDLRASFSKSARKGLSIAEKKHVRIEECGVEAAEQFARVMHCTEERKGIALRDLEYFKKLMQAYPQDSVICLAKLPLKKLYEESIQKLTQNEEALKQCPPNAKKKRFTLEEQHSSFTREVKELKEDVEKNGDEVIIAGGLCVKFGPSAELLYAGMDERYKRYMPSYAAFCACMEWSFAHGCTSCNMGGVEGTLDGGLMRFKSNFNPTINEFIGEFDFPVHSLLYRCAMAAYHYRKKQMAKHHK